MKTVFLLTVVAMMAASSAWAGFIATCNAWDNPKSQVRVTMTSTVSRVSPQDDMAMDSVIRPAIDVARKALGEDGYVETQVGPWFTASHHEADNLNHAYDLAIMESRKSTDGSSLKACFRKNQGQAECRPITADNYREVVEYFLSKIGQLGA